MDSLTLDDKRKVLQRAVEIRKAGKTPTSFSACFFQLSSGLFECNHPKVDGLLSLAEVQAWIDEHVPIFPDQGPHLIWREGKTYEPDQEPRAVVDDNYSTSPSDLL